MSTIQIICNDILLPEFYRTASDYPYFMIIKSAEATNYSVFEMDKKLYFDSSTSTYKVDASCYYKEYQSDGESDWEETAEGTTTDITTLNSLDDLGIIWINYNIVNNTTNKVLYSSNAKYNDYNGLSFLEIPEYLMTEYPYLFITKRYLSEDVIRYAYTIAKNKATYNTSAKALYLNGVYWDIYSNEDLLYLLGKTTSDSTGEYITLEGDDTDDYPYEVIWSNYDIECDPASDGIYFKGGEEYYSISRNKLVAFGDQVRRIIGTEEKLTTNEMLDILGSIQKAEEVSF